MLYILPNNEAEWKPCSLKQCGLLGHSQQEALRNKPSKDSPEQLSQHKFPKDWKRRQSRGFSCLLVLCFVRFGVVWFFNQEPVQTFPQGRVEILLKGERMNAQWTTNSQCILKTYSSFRALKLRIHAIQDSSSKSPPSWFRYIWGEKLFLHCF